MGTRRPLRIVWSDALFRVVGGKIETAAQRCAAIPRVERAASRGNSRGGAGRDCPNLIECLQTSSAWKGTVLARQAEGYSVAAVAQSSDAGGRCASISRIKKRCIDGFTDYKC